MWRPFSNFLFFFNDTATTEIYTLSLHDALPISPATTTCSPAPYPRRARPAPRTPAPSPAEQDRKSTRLNSSHSQISYAVFCLKKKNKRSSGAFPYEDRAPLRVLCTTHGSDYLRQ